MIDGVLYLAPSADFEHGEAGGEFYAELRAYLKRNALGRATLETDVMLPDGGDVLRPDGCFLLKENWHKKKRRIHGAPDLVWEALSDSTAERDLGEKSRRYLLCGVREYWLLDPRTRGLEVRYAMPDQNGKPCWETGFGPVRASRLLHGFELDPREFWRFLDQA